MWASGLTVSYDDFRLRRSCSPSSTTGTGPYPCSENGEIAEVDVIEDHLQAVRALAASRK